MFVIARVHALKLNHSASRAHALKLTARQNTDDLACSSAKFLRFLARNSSDTTPYFTGDLRRLS